MLNRKQAGDSSSLQGLNFSSLTPQKASLPANQSNNLSFSTSKPPSSEVDDDEPPPLVTVPLTGPSNTGPLAPPSAPGVPFGALGPAGPAAGFAPQQLAFGAGKPMGGHSHGGHSHHGPDHDHGHDHGHSHDHGHGHGHDEESGHGDSCGHAHGGRDGNKWEQHIMVDVAACNATRERGLQNAPEAECGAMTDLFVAVQRADQGTVERLLHASPNLDLNALDSKGNAILHYATRRPHAGIALLLLSRGANPNLRSNNELREPPLHGAIVMNEIQLVHQMVTQQNADIHATNAKGYNALHTAVQYRRFLLAAYLLRSGAHVDAADNEAHTPLHWAAYVGDARLARLLINHNADATRVDDRGMNPMHWAAAKGFLEVVDELTTPTRGNDAKTEIDVYTQMKTREQQGLTPEELARRNNHLKVADYIAVLKKVIYADHPFGRKYRLPTSFVVAAICIVLFAYSFAKLPWWGFVIVLGIAYFCGAGKRIMWLAQENSPAFIATHGTAHAIMLYIIFSKIVPNVYEMNSMGTLLLVLFLIPIECELFRRLVMNNRGKYIAYKPQDILSVVQAVSSGESAKEFCQSCLMKKIPRSKHCVDCDRCVEKFDHQCVWTTRCVARRNYRDFVIFCALLVLNIHLANYLCLQLVWMNDPTLSLWSALKTLTAEQGWVVGFLIFMNINGLTIGILLGLHVYLISRNLTTNELFNWRRYEYLQDEFGKYKNSYDRGLLANWKEFLSSSGRQIASSVV